MINKFLSFPSTDKANGDARQPPSLSLDENKRRSRVRVRIVFSLPWPSSDTRGEESLIRSSHVIVYVLSAVVMWSLIRRKKEKKKEREKKNTSPVTHTLPPSLSLSLSLFLSLILCHARISGVSLVPDMTSEDHDTFVWQVLVLMEPVTDTTTSVKLFIRVTTKSSSLSFECLI